MTRAALGLDLDLSFGLPASTLRLPSFVDCLMCSRTNIGRGARFCGKCLTERANTPLRRYRWAMGKTLRDLERETRLRERTLLRADAGHRMSEHVARILEKHTGIPWRRFRPEEG